VAPLAAYLRSLNPHLPRSIQILQAGGLANAFGNGLIIPFLFIYLNNVRGIGYDTAGLIVGTNAAVGLIVGPLFGPLIDRVGGRRTLAVSLLFLLVGFGGYPFIETAWQGFLVSALAGIGNGGFWPSQSSLLAGLAYAVLPIKLSPKALGPLRDFEKVAGIGVVLWLLVRLTPRDVVVEHLDALDRPSLWSRLRKRADTGEQG